MVGEKRHKLASPNGGWGYAVVAAITIVFIATVVPLAAFGIVFGEFLASIGNSTSGTTLVTTTYNTVSFFMGLVANVLLSRYSYRKVGLLGALIHLLGALGVIFITKLEHLIFLYGVVEGIGFGLILPAALSAFNAYFDKKMPFMMSICQTIVVVGFILIPQIGTWSMHVYGFRGSILLLAGLSAFCVPAALTLQPIKWHLIKVKNEDIQENDPQHFTKIEIVVKEPLLNQNNTIMENNKPVQAEQPRKGKSDVPLGERIGSLASIKSELQTDNRDTSFCQSLLKSMDLHLLKDKKYLNISIGLSLSFTSDVAFYPIIPSIMNHIGFSSSEIAMMMSVFFGSDLVARISLTILSAFWRIKSRYLVLGASAFSGIFRIVLFLNDTLRWKVVILAILGYCRCFIQTPIALVVSEEYPEKFATAYSLYMAINGVVCLVLGQLMSFVKFATDSDFWVSHILTIAFFANVVSWTLEIYLTGKRERKNGILAT